MSKNSGGDLEQPKNDDSFTLGSKNERIARYTRNQRPQNRSGSSTLEHKCVSVVKKQWRQPNNDDCFTLCTKNEQIARYTRHQRPQNRSGSSTLERKCVSVVQKQRGRPWATMGDLKMTTIPTLWLQERANRAIHAKLPTSKPQRIVHF